MSQIAQYIDINRMIKLIWNIQDALGVANDVSDDLKELYQKRELLNLRDE